MTEEKMQPEEVKCYSCGKELEPVFDSETKYQFHNALWIDFSGGYSMFVDSMHEWVLGGENPLRVVICHNCAHELCILVEWIDRLLQPATSHNH